MLLRRSHSQYFLLFLTLLGLSLAHMAVAAPAVTTTVVNSASNPSRVGNAVNFTATVSSPTTGVTGIVNFTVDGSFIGSAVVNAGGGNSGTTSPATSVTFSTGGSHTVTAAFVPTDSTAFTSSSGSFNQVVQAIPTINPFTANPASPSRFGQAVTLSATVANGFGTPTGSIQFSDANGPLGPPVNLDGTGKATYTTSSLRVGTSYTINAAYSGDSFNTNATGTLTYTVQAADTTAATPSASPASPKVGQSVTLSSAVSVAGPGTGTPTGTITFSDGAGFSADGAVGSNRIATVTTSGLSAGGHNITATYNGDGNYNASSPSLGLSLTVGADATATSVTSSGNPSVFGQSVTFTITVTNTSSTGIPTGSVTLTYPSTSGSNATTGAVTLNGNGQAQISVAAIAVGSGQTITANYTPADGNFTASNGSVTQTVSAATTTTTVASSNNPSVVNQPVTFTAIVTTQAPGSGAPTGSVSFAVTKGGVTTTLTSTRTASGNAATFTSAGDTFSAAGVYSVTATYTPDVGNFTTSSASLSPNQQVTATATTVTATATPASSIFGQPVTLSASVVGVGGVTPTGSIQFSADGATVGSAQLLALDSTDASGNTATASLAGVTLPVGTHNVVATYTGDTNYAPGSGSTTEAVSQATTNTAVSTSNATSTFGALVTFTATVTDSASGSTGTPQGTVTFVDATTGSSLGTGTLAADGTASVATATLSAITHNITATYNGNANFAGSTGSVSQNVNPAGTTTALSFNPTSPGLNLPVTFTATVSNTSGTGVTPNGTVSFSDGGTVLGSGSLSGNGGSATATFSTTFAVAGGHTITAAYSPAGGNFAASSDQKTVTVGKSGGQTGTPVTLTSNAPNNTLTFGQPVTFNAIVSGNAGVTPIGTVTFTDDVSGVLGTSSLSGGRASLTTAVLSAGTHNITATYSGDANFAPGTSAALTQTVTPAATSTTVTSPTNVTTVGGTTTFTATVVNTSGTGVTPDGTVMFFDAPGNNPTRTAVSSALPLTVNAADNSLNSAVVSFPTSALGQGQHNITADYTPASSPSSNFGPSSSRSFSLTSFNGQAAIQSFDQTSLLVPGTIKYTPGANSALTAAQILRATDSQPLGINVSNLTTNPTPSVYFNGTKIDPNAVKIDSGTHVTATISAGLAATSGFAEVRVVNGGTQSDFTGASRAFITVNPVMALPTYPVSSTRALRLFSLPYDYSGLSPYDIAQATALSTLPSASRTSAPIVPVPGAGGFQYDPINELLTGLTRFTQQSSDATFLALYHWDPTQIRYLTTVPASGKQADNVPFVLGQAFWAIGGTGSQFLGVLKIGTPAGFNPTGIPLQAGWNMVGDPFPTPVDMNSLQVSYQGITLPLFSTAAKSAVSEGIVSPLFWSYEQAKDGTTGYQINYGGLAGHSALKPYEGYWFYSYQACTLLVGNTPPATQ